MVKMFRFFIVRANNSYMVDVLEFHVFKLNESGDPYKIFIDVNTPPTAKSTYRFVDLFCGAGGVKENHGGTHIHPYLNRVISAREMARLQTFPDSFIFKGSMKKAMWQIGNAVPPRLVECLCYALIPYLNAIVNCTVAADVRGKTDEIIRRRDLPENLPDAPIPSVATESLALLRNLPGLTV